MEKLLVNYNNTVLGHEDETYNPFLYHKEFGEICSYNKSIEMVLRFSIEDLIIVSKRIRMSDTTACYYRHKTLKLLVITYRAIENDYSYLQIWGDVKEEEAIDKFVESIEVDKRSKVKRSTVSIVCRNAREYYLRSIDIKKDIKTVSDDIGLLYGKEFEELYVYTKDKLLNQSNGLVLFYGPPGTGKTSILKYMISDIEKSIIYLPSNTFHSLDDPAFISFAIENFNNCIVVIEDADNMLKKRDGGSSGTVSNLLNISDGIMGHILKCSFVCTFNMHVQDIDDALLRKGRLVSKWEFKPLDKGAANAICDKYGFKRINREANLADVFNQEDKSFSKVKTKIGFV